MKCLLAIAALAFGIHADAQDCTGYYFLQANKTIELAVYNKKGAETARQVYSVSNVTNEGSSRIAVITTRMLDKKGKEISKGQSKMKCDNGIMKVDMRLSIPTTPGQAVESDMQADDIFIEYPASISVGDDLKDATMHVEMDNRGMKQTVDMEITKRKVEAKQSVTTSAGTWDCFKISQHIKMRVKTMGMAMPMNMDATEWYAPGFGVVKTESKQGSTAVVSIK